VPKQLCFYRVADKDIDELGREYVSSQVEQLLEKPRNQIQEDLQAHIDESNARNELAEFAKIPMEEAYTKFGEQGVAELLDKFAESQSKCGLCGTRLQTKAAKYRPEAPRLPAAMCRKCWYETRDHVLTDAKQVLERRRYLIQEAFQAAFDESCLPTGTVDYNKKLEYARDLMDAKGDRLRELVAKG
jgi:hypothetical protein